MTDWKPIDTAPRDGSIFATLIPAEEGGRGPIYGTSEWDFQLSDFVQHGCGFDYVTHWCALPPTPADFPKG